jgi:FixJ family two-component response regulator
MNPQETGNKHRPRKNERGVILVVDDDPAVLTSLKFALELEGFVVKAFSTAQSLLRHRIGRHVCLVIDYRLPDTNGLDLLQRLRAKGVVAPAVIITSHPSEDVRRRAAKLAVPIVEKPFLGNSLIATIKEQSELVTEVRQ